MPILLHKLVLKVNLVDVSEEALQKGISTIISKNPDRIIETKETYRRKKQKPLEDIPRKIHNFHDSDACRNAENIVAATEKPRTEVENLQTNG